MLSRSSRALLLFLSLNLAGCHDSRPLAPGADASTDDAGSGTDGQTAGSISLNAYSSRTTSRSVITPGSGRELLLVDMELTNQTDEPAPLLSDRFAVTTDLELEITAHTSTYQLEGGCPTDGSVSPGATVRCWLLFEIALGQTPVLLLYRADPPASTTVPAPTVDLGEEATNQCIHLIEGDSDFQCFDCIGSARISGGNCRDFHSEVQALCSYVLDFESTTECERLLEADDSCAIAQLEAMECFKDECPTECNQ